MQIKKAVILAAGEGTRMRPLTYTRPKVMLPLANKPILEHLLNEMRLAGIRDFIFIVGYHDEQVRNHFGDGSKWDVTIQYCNQRMQAGTADALKMAEGLVDEPFLLSNGDSIFSHEEIKKLIQRDTSAIAVMPVENPSGYGIVETSNGYLSRIYEKPDKPPSNLASTGLYLFTPAIFSAVSRIQRSPRGEYELPDAIQLMISSGQIIEVHEISQWMDFSYPWDLLSANEKIIDSLPVQEEGTIESGAIIKGKVSTGKGTVIKAGSYIIGPVVIGENCDIGPNCYIRPGCAIASNCHIGAGVEVKNSIIMTGSKIPHLSYVGDSIIGENCNLGAGTKIANLRLDKQNIIVGNINTRRRKLGAIIGDNVQTGINVSINTGTIIGNNCFIGPGALAHGIIAPGSKIF